MNNNGNSMDGLNIGLQNVNILNSTDIGILRKKAHMINRLIPGPQKQMEQLSKK